MKKKSILCILFAFLLSCGNEEEIPKQPGGGGDTDKETVDYKLRAKEIYDRTMSRYRINSGTFAGMFYESVPRQTGDPQCCFLWSWDWCVSGITLMHKLGYNVGYNDVVDRYQKYYMNGSAVQPTVGGYGPGTAGTENSGNGDRYYDDNSITGVNLVDAYIITGEQRYLDRARQIVAFIRTAWDNHLGGGMWWREPNRNPESTLRDDLKPSCANVYGNFFLLKYYKVCPSAEKAAVLAFAKDIYKWECETLQGGDNLFFTGIQATGTIEYGKDPGVIGVMIENAVFFYDITKEQKYLADAMRWADASYDYFVKVRGKDGEMLFPNNEPWSSAKLFRAYLDLKPYYPGATKYIDTYIKYMDYAYKNARNADGFFWEDFTGNAEGRSYMLLTQDAALESYAAIALYKEGKL